MEIHLFNFPVVGPYCSARPNNTHREAPNFDASQSDHRASAGNYQPSTTHEEAKDW